MKLSKSMKHLKRFRESVDISELTLDFIRDILIDIIDDGFTIHGPYDSNQGFQYFIDKGISEDDVVDEDDYNNMYFMISDVIDSLVKLVDYTGLRFEFTLGDIRRESERYTIDELINVSNTSISDYTYIVINIF